MTSPDSTAFFARSWTLYDLITEYNYMFHREIYAKIEDLLKQRKECNRYLILDLGCGNARFLAPGLLKCPPAYYQGVDLSEAALAEARGYLACLSCEVVLTHGELLDTLQATESKWDVIFTGFAVHHLASQDKARFFQAVGRCLSDNGWLLMVDVMREERQTRKDYLEEYLGFMRDCWTRIPADELEAACAHVETYDYPESLSALQEMANESGLQGSKVISQFGQHYTVLFSRNSLPQTAF